MFLHTVFNTIIQMEAGHLRENPQTPQQQETRQATPQQVRHQGPASIESSQNFGPDLFSSRCEGKVSSCCMR